MAVFSDESFVITSDTSKVDHLKFLINEFDTHDYHKLSNLAGKVKFTAYAIGHDKTINELVPFLSAKQMDLIEADNEFVRSLPNMWIDLAPHVGSIKNCELLMKNMEPLIAHHEEEICKMAVGALKSFIIKSTDENKNSIVNDFITPLILALFTQGANKIRYLKPAFILSNSFLGFIQSEKTRAEILQKVSLLIQPFLPYVRLQIVIYYIDGVCQTITKDDILHYILPGLNKLWKTEIMFRHRHKILETYYTISKKLDSNENLEYTLPRVIDACKDSKLISNPTFYHLFVKFLSLFNEYHLMSHFVPIYESFASSLNNVFKPFAIACLKYLVNEISENEFETKYIKSIKKWSQDPCPFVQTLLVEALLFITTTHGLDYANSHIRKVIYKIFLDGSVEHRSKLLSNYPDLAKLFLFDEPNNPIQNALLLNAHDKVWRNRVKFAETFLPIIRKMGHDLVFNYYILVLRKLMFDEVHAVRNATALQIEAMFKEMTNDEVNDFLWPFLMQIYYYKNITYTKDNLNEGGTTPTYLIQINILNVIEPCVSTLSLDIVNKRIIPFIIKTLQEPIPNLRLKSMSIVKNLRKNTSIDRKLLINKFASILSEIIKNDKFPDVRFAGVAAHKALFS